MEAEEGSEVRASEVMEVTGDPGDSEGPEVSEVMEDSKQDSDYLEVLDSEVMEASEVSH